MKNDFRKGSVKRTKNIIKSPMPAGGNTTIFYNDGPDICANACSCCWDKPCPTTTDKQITYLGKRVTIGHTSVLEHSNVVTYFQIPSSMNEDLIEFLDACHYVDTCRKPSEMYDGSYLLIGGSYRAYADIYRRIGNLGNSILRLMTQATMFSIPKEMYSDLQKDDAINTSSYNYVEADTSKCADISNYKVDENITIINIDSMQSLKDAIGSWCPEPELFETWDLMPMLNATILFRHMSRTGTHQLVRHRNAITQESQRYVDYSEAKFASPDKFKPEKYDSEHVYKIEIDGHTIEATLSELGVKLQGIYAQLRDESLGDYALLKEDARAYLPSNTECDKIYITFSFRTLFMFLKLREDPAAQAEIRLYATTIGNWLRETFPEMNQEFMDQMLRPRYDINPDPIQLYTSEIGMKISEEAYIATIPEDKEVKEKTEE